ncbi:acyltransferase domain-containing protein, partial [Streptomyces asoensis]|uniref:acyltransferase domain-containing protein n=1 Tax=Streptomyces asoensis TaxID=249586 RepID=UPI00332E4F8F
MAGGLSVEDGARVVVLRARAIAQSLSGHGGMVSVAAGAERVRELIAGWGERISIASVNGPSSTVVSGEPDALDDLMAACDGEGIRARRIAVDYASHSAQVESIRDQVTEALEDIEPRAAEVPFYSTVLGSLIDTSGLDATYWVTNLRQEVRFDATVRELLADGFGYFVECSPHPVLTVGMQETFEDHADAQAVALGTLRREEGGPERLLTSLAEGYVRGLAVDWHTLFAGTGAQRVDLPTYAFQHQRYWLEAGGFSEADAGGLGLGAADHPLLGATVQVAGGGQLLLTGRLSLQTHPWLADHAALGTVLLPGAAFAELALRAADEAGCGRVDELTLEAPLLLPERGGVQVQLSVGAPDEEGRRELTVYSRPEDPAVTDDTWQRHAVGVLAGDSGPAPEAGLGEWPPVGGVRVEVAKFYEQIGDAGYGYGPAFRGLRSVWRVRGEVFAEVELPEEQAKDAARFGIHPALLDAALHPAALLSDGDAAGGQLLMPFSWSGISLHAVGATTLRVRISPVAEDTVTVAIGDATGAPVASVHTLTLRPVTPEALRRATDPARDALFLVDWVPLRTEHEAPAEAQGWAVLGADGLFEGVAGRHHADLAGLLAELDDAEPGTESAAVPGTVLLVLQASPHGVDGELPALVHRATTEVLEHVRTWLDDERLTSSRLVLVTRNAVSAGGDEDVTDLVHAPVWGLVRSAQSENPGRFVLVDVDGGPA